MPMTRRDTILICIAYLSAPAVTAGGNFHGPGPPAIPPPPAAPVAEVGGGTLEGAPFGALYGMACGAVLSGLGHLGAVCVASLALFGWAAGLCAQYLLRRDAWGHLICSVAVLLAWEGWAVGSRLLARLAPAQTLLRVAGPELLCSLAFILPVYWLGRFCCVHYGRIYHE